MGKLYTCEEVAKIFGVKTLTVWSWIRNGRMEAIKMPKGYRIEEKAIKAYTNNKSKKGAR